MNPYFGVIVIVAALASPVPAEGPAPTQQTFASLGDFALENGQIVRDCRLGYRLYGQNNGSNVIVLTTWLGGTSGGLAAWVGPGKLFDSSKYFIVSIDAFGNGVSSSPSNSRSQPGDQFPHFTIRDMVHAQHELLTRELGIHHVRAVGGLSFGGMQTFQWIASYPGFMDQAIAIVGTPKQTSFDLLLWKTELELLESGHDERAMNAIADINEMTLHTPAFIAAHTKAEDLDALMSDHQRSLRRIDPYDYASQLRAMIAHDAGTAPIKAKVLVVVSAQDHTVNPAPALEFARRTKAELVTLNGDCGHLATVCEQETLKNAVVHFLERK